MCRGLLWGIRRWREQISVHPNKVIKKLWCHVCAKCTLYIQRPRDQTFLSSDRQVLHRFQYRSRNKWLSHNRLASSSACDIGSTLYSPPPPSYSQTQA